MPTARKKKAPAKRTKGKKPSTPWLVVLGLFGLMGYFVWQQQNVREEAELSQKVIDLVKEHPEAEIFKDVENGQKKSP